MYHNGFNLAFQVYLQTLKKMYVKNPWLGCHSDESDIKLRAHDYLLLTLCIQMGSGTLFGMLQTDNQYHKFSHVFVWHRITLSVVHSGQV